MTARGALELAGIVKRYEQTAVVDGISLSIRAGEFVTLLGPSGSGKTTTLNMIAGFTSVDEGGILLDGAPIADVPAHRREIGVVFQHYALFPHLTVSENIAFPLRRRHVPRAERERRVAQALDLVQLGDFASRRPRQLSGGQQQRVALARALVFEPPLLLMDEPLSALDKKLREGLQLELKRIHRELGITFIYVTHDQEEALVLSDRIAVLNRGRVEQVGAAEDLYRSPQTLFVASFIGESNVFHGRVEGDEGSLTLRSGDHTLHVPASAPRPPSRIAALVVRPERIAVGPPAEQGLATTRNVLSGVVYEVIYLGATRKLEVELADGRVVIARESDIAGSAPRPGQAVELSWATDDATLVTTSEPPGG